MKIRLICLLALAAGQASAQLQEVQRCRGLPEAVQRLACYDAIPLPAGMLSVGSPAAAKADTLAAPAPGVTATPAATASGFGLPPKPAAPEPTIESSVPATFDGWGPQSLIRLANGQVWRIADDSSTTFDGRVRRVRIVRGFLGSYYMELEGMNLSPRVRRVS